MRTDLALAALASAAVPGMKPVAVAAIGPDDDGRASELQSALVEDATGRRWVVRAPLTPVAGARLQRNDELVRQLSRHVPFKVPAAVGYAPVGKDGSAAVYPYVEGSPLDLRRLPSGPGLASAVGRALAAVHNIPRAVFEEQDVPVFDASGARQRAVAEVDRAAETGRVPTGLLARWEEAFEAAPLWQFATTPVHGSFTGASVVVAFTDEDDAATGRVVAVTDWDESMIGDPAVDLAELWSQSSRSAWEAVLDSYTLARAHRPDPYLHARARLVAELRTLRGLARAVADGDEEETRRAVEALRRVDRLTEADDSLVPVTARPSGSRPSRPTGAVMPVDTGLPGEPGPSEASAQEASDETFREDTHDDDLGGAEDVSGAQPHGDDATHHPLDADGDGDGDADPTMEVPRPTEGPGGAVTSPLHDGRDLHAGHDADDRAEADDDDATVQLDPLAQPVSSASIDQAAQDPDGAAHHWSQTGSASDGGTESMTAAAPGHEEVADDEVEDHHLVRSDDPPAGAGDPSSASPDERPGLGGTDTDVGEQLDAGQPIDAVPGEGEREREPLTDTELQDEERQDDDFQDEERLHELYGMPSPDRDTKDR